MGYVVQKKRLLRFFFFLEKSQLHQGSKSGGGSCQQAPVVKVYLINVKNNCFFAWVIWRGDILNEVRSEDQKCQNSLESLAYM